MKIVYRYFTNSLVEYIKGKLLKQVEIFKAGTYRGKEYTKADLEKMVRNFNLLKKKKIYPNVPVRVDHGNSAHDVCGYIEKLTVKGKKLIADLDITEENIYQKIKRTTLRSRSVEIGTYDDNKGNSYYPVVYGVAWVDIPQVEGLAPVLAAAYGKGVKIINLNNPTNMTKPKNSDEKNLKEKDEKDEKFEQGNENNESEENENQFEDDEQDEDGDDKGEGGDEKKDNEEDDGENEEEDNSKDEENDDNDKDESEDEEDGENENDDDADDDKDEEDDDDSEKDEEKDNDENKEDNEAQGLIKDIDKHIEKGEEGGFIDESDFKKFSMKLSNIVKYASANKIKASTAKKLVSTLQSVNKMLIDSGKYYSASRISEILYSIESILSSNMNKDKVSEKEKLSKIDVNELPDSSFAVIEPAYLYGKITDKGARHLPYKNADGKIILSSLRESLTMMNKIKPISDSISESELRVKAKDKILKVAKRYLHTSKFAKTILNESGDTVKLRREEVTALIKRGEEADELRKENETLRLEKRGSRIDVYCKEGKITPAMAESEKKLAASMTDAQFGFYCDSKNEQPAIVDFDKEQVNDEHDKPDGESKSEKKADESADDFINETNNTFPKNEEKDTKRKKIAPSQLEEDVDKFFDV